MTVAVLANPQSMPLLTNVEQVPSATAARSNDYTAEPQLATMMPHMSWAAMRFERSQDALDAPSAPASSDSRNASDDAIDDASNERGGIEILDVVETDAHDTDEIRWYDGRPIRPKKTIVMTVTAYSPDERSCGDSADGYTASGYSVWTNGMKLVAADADLLPFGALVSVPGYDGGTVVPVLDRGGAIKGKRLDVLYPTHERARQWGVQKLEVTIWEYADGKPANFRTQHQNHPDYGKM